MDRVGWVPTWLQGWEDDQVDITTALISVIKKGGDMDIKEIQDWIDDRFGVPNTVNIQVYIDFIMEDPCVDCDKKREDEYGLFCDLSCGKATAYANYQWGVKSVLSWIRRHDLIKPDDNSITRFEPFYQIAESDIEL